MLHHIRHAATLVALFVSFLCIPQAFANAEFLVALGRVLRTPSGFFVLSQTREGQVLASRMLGKPVTCLEELDEFAQGASKKMDDVAQEELFLRLSKLQSDPQATLMKGQLGSDHLVKWASRALSIEPGLNRSVRLVKAGNLKPKGLARARAAFMNTVRSAPQEALPSEIALERVLRNFENYWVRHAMEETQVGRELARRILKRSDAYRQTSSWEEALHALADPKHRAFVLELDFRLGTFSDALTNYHPSIGAEEYLVVVEGYAVQFLSLESAALEFTAFRSPFVGPRRRSSYYELSEAEVKRYNLRDLVDY